MNRVVIALRGLVCLALLCAGVPVSAATNWPTQNGDVTLKDFRFADGEKLDSLRLHYITLGTPVRDAAGQITNAVLLLHGTVGSSAQFLIPSFADPLFGQGEPLDIRKFYVVVPDGIGAGESSKPSDGLHARFPHYGYKDQVLAQHELLDQIGVHHLRLVLGPSMGGMQAWLWGETYPNGMDALVALATTPAPLNGRNMLWRQMIVQAIRQDPGWNGGDYPPGSPPQGWIRTAIPLFTIMTGNAEQLERLLPLRSEAEKVLGALEAKAKATDPKNYLYTFESWADYDPASKLGAITKPILAINFEDDLLNPPELLRFPSLPGLTHVMLPGGEGSFGHLTANHADKWAPALKTFLAKVPGWPASP